MDLKEISIRCSNLPYLPLVRDRLSFRRRVRTVNLLNGDGFDVCVEKSDTWTVHFGVVQFVSVGFSEVEDICFYDIVSEIRVAEGIICLSEKSAFGRGPIYENEEHQHTKGDP